MTTRVPSRRFVALVVFSLLVAACSGGGTAGGADPLTVFGNYRDSDAAAFRKVLDRFTEETGIETRYVGTAAFALRIQDRIREGDPPDVALFPQPAIFAEMVRAGHIAPLDATTAAAVTEGYADWGVDLVTVDESVYGVWYRLSLKSLVWYPPKVFTANGYQIPETWDELEALTRQMVSDGFTPWCLGMESFDATGWAGTDWIEDIVLRFHGPNVYDQWTAGDIPFTDPRIEEAFTEFADLTLARGQTLGGRRAILSVPVLEAILPMFSDPPGCLLNRQASFQEEELPSAVTVGPDGDVDVFVLPPKDGPEAPLLASGEIAAAFTDSAEAQSLIAFLLTPEAGEIWAELGGYKSPLLDFDVSKYKTGLERRIGELVAEADVVRFDGSDLMPPAVGSGSFWRGMVDLVAGERLSEVLDDIQKGYDTDEG